jgi:hypothetical protein
MLTQREFGPLAVATVLRGARKSGDVLTKCAIRMFEGLAPARTLVIHTR